MKRNRFFLPLLASAMLAATAGLTLSSCAYNDDNPVTDPTAEYDDDHDRVDDDVNTAPEDPMGDFMARFISTTNEEGNTQSAAYGQALDDADPTVLSIGVESLEVAEEMFRIWATDSLHLLTVSAGNLVYTPTTPDGQPQGTIYFNESSADCLARITFSDDVPHKDEVSEIRFIDRRQWPDNGDTMFTIGHEYVYMSSGSDYFCDVENLQKFTGDLYDVHRYRCVDEGGEGRPALLWCYDCGEWGSYSYDANIECQYIRGGTLKYGTYYGMWNGSVKGEGNWVRSVWNKEKGKSDPDVTPNLSSLKEVSLWIQRNNRFLNKYFGSSWNKSNDIFWARDHCKSGFSFHLYGYIMGQRKEGHWRSWTTKGRWSQVVRAAILPDIVRPNDQSGYVSYVSSSDITVYGYCVKLH